VKGWQKIYKANGPPKQAGVVMLVSDKVENVYTFFASYSPSYPLSLPPPTDSTPLCHDQDLFCPPVLQFCRRKMKKK
jgi:hypothetical protein